MGNAVCIPKLRETCNIISSTASIMEGQSSNDGQLAHMHTILRIARDLKETTSQKSDTFRNLPLHASSATSVSDVNLPSPPSILPALLSTGADYKTSISVNQKYQLRAEEFRKNAQDSIINATRKLAELPSIGGSTPEKLLAKTTAAFTQVYLGKLENWKEEVISLVKHHTQLRPSAKTSKDSRGFNNVSGPSASWLYVYHNQAGIYPLTRTLFRREPIP